MASLGAVLRPSQTEELIGEFERRFASYIGVKHAVMVPSARLGLAYVLEALGLDPGAEVAVPAFTYHSIPSTIIHKGCRPLFVDVGRSTYTLDPTLLDFAITPQTQAVIPTHLYGKPCAMDEVMRIANARGLAVIEDCAQSVGAEHRGTKAGSFGDAAYYTFGITKNLTTLMGGMVTTHRDDVAGHVRARVAELPRTGAFAVLETAALATCMAVATTRWAFTLGLWPLIRLFGIFDLDPVHDAFAERPQTAPVPEAQGRHGHRAHAAQGAVGLAQLDRCDALNDARIATARMLLARLSHRPELILPESRAHQKHIFVTFAIQTERRDELARFLRFRGIDTTTGYMDDCSNMPVFEEHHRSCEIAGEIKHTLLHLPLYPSLSEADVEYMVACIDEFFAGGAVDPLLVSSPANP